MRLGICGLGMMGQESEWVYYWRDAVRTMAGRELTLGSTLTPDNNAILRYHRHIRRGRATVSL